jgi:hypothetical protein
MTGSIAVSNGYLYYGVADPDDQVHQGKVYELVPYSGSSALASYEEDAPDGGHPTCVDTP